MNKKLKFFKRPFLMYKKLKLFKRPFFNWADIIIMVVIFITFIKDHHVKLVPYYMEFYAIPNSSHVLVVWVRNLMLVHPSHTSARA